VEDMSSCFPKTWTLPAYNYRYSPRDHDLGDKPDNLWTNFTCTEPSASVYADNIKMEIKISMLNLFGYITPQLTPPEVFPTGWASATQAETLGNQLWISVQVHTAIDTGADKMTWIDLPYNAVKNKLRVLFVKPKIFYTWKPTTGSNGSVDWDSKKAVFDTGLQNYRFFAHIESRLELLSFDTNCGWGNEAYWKRS
jgi:hypothetical protein